MQVPSSRIQHTIYITEDYLAQVYTDESGIINGPANRNRADIQMEELAEMEYSPGNGNERHEIDQETRTGKCDADQMKMQS